MNFPAFSSKDHTAYFGDDILGYLKHRNLQLVLGTAIFFLSSLLAIYIFTSPENSKLPMVDLFNLIFVVAAFVVCRKYPEISNIVKWLVFASILINVADGLGPYSDHSLGYIHVLLPALVLYGALLGSLPISLISMGIALALYGATAYMHAPLERHVFLTLLSLGLLTITITLASLMVWWNHTKFIETIKGQAKDLEERLEENLRLHSVIFHDIANPLGILQTTAELGESKGRIEGEEIKILKGTLERVEAIIESVRDFSLAMDSDDHLEVVSVGALFSELKNAFAEKLREKEVDLTLAEGEENQVKTHHRIMVDSILSNILSNAIKHSPRGTSVTISSFKENGYVAIQLRDRGDGFPAGLLDSELASGNVAVKRGSEGEPGFGKGLLIAKMYLKKLGGKLELSNGEDGGACATVNLPAA